MTRPRQHEQMKQRLADRKAAAEEAERQAELQRQELVKRLRKLERDHAKGTLHPPEMGCLECDAKRKALPN